MLALAFRVQAAQVADGLCRRHPAPQHGHIRGHAAAGRFVVVRQQRLHLRRGVHQRQCLRALRRLQVQQDVGGIVGIHLVQQLRQYLCRQAGCQLRGFILIQVLKHIRCVFCRQRGQHARLLFQVQVADGFSEVGQLQLLQQLARALHVILLKRFAHIAQHGFKLNCVH